MTDKRKMRLICLMICKNEFYTENYRFGNKIKVNRSARYGEPLFYRKPNLIRLGEI